MEVRGNGIVVTSNDPLATERAAQVIADLFSIYQRDVSTDEELVEVSVSGVSYFVRTKAVN